MRRIEPVPDDGYVCIRGHIVTVEWASWNAREHLAGFDDLPKALRDQINYAPTPELGARPTRELAQRHRLIESAALDSAMTVATALARNFLADE